MTDDTCQKLRTHMVNTQVRPSDVTSYPIIHAFLTVPREKFVPSDKGSIAYADAPIILGKQRQLMEARSFGKMLNTLQPKREDAVLIIAAGLGYSAAIFSQLVDSVIAIEDDPELAQEAEAALNRAQYHNAVILEAELTEGVKNAGPFDMIFIDAGVQCIPDILLEQLNEGGKIGATFVTDNFGEFRLGVKTSGSVDWRPMFTVMAPLLPGFVKTEAFTL